MEYDRIFCFGCSWTHYKWPSWADIVRYSTDKPVYNWGLRGIGNVGIMHRIMECDLANKFTERDLILVQWSTWTREDRYLKNKWQAGGAIFHNNFYDKGFVNKYWSWNNDTIKNSTAILMTNKAYKLGYQFTFYPFPNDPDFDQMTFDRDNKLLKFWKSHLPNVDVFPNLELNTDFNGNCVDGHADVKAHLDFFNRFIKDKFNLNLGKKEMKLLILHDTISESLSKKQNLQDQDKIIKSIVEQFDPTINKETLGF
jgi:hypothetical protein